MGALLARVAHDLRSTLQTLTLGASVLGESTGLAESERKALGRMTNSMRRLERLIGQLSSYGEMPPAVTARSMDLVELTEGLVRDAARREPDRVITLHGEAQSRGVWDAELLGRMVDELLNHAMRRSRGPITVTITDDRDAVLAVHDVGPPIAPAAHAVLFADPLDCEGEVGFGLYLVDQIARAHGGSVTAESNAGGTVVSVHLPRNR